METLLALWTGAPELKIKLAVLVVLCHMALTIWCYAQMSRARMGAAKAGKVTADIYKAVGDAEPEEIRVFTRLVANQFESPVLFYAVIIAGLAIGVTSWITVLLGIGYVAFRVMHAREMAGAHNVMRRRQLFIFSIRMLLLLMVELLISTLFMLNV